jgi:glutamate/tyrosine decarboxylase-like PLP-dependent enzyme
MNDDTAGAGRRPADTLGLTEPEMRRLGYRVVDLVVDHLAQRDTRPAAEWTDPAELIARCGAAPPEEPADPDAALEKLVELAIANKQHLDHPRYFARVPGPSSFAAVLGDWLSTGFNTTANSWATSPGPSAMEYAVLGWLRTLLGLPEGGDGILTSGGSMANLTAFAAARAERGTGIAYMSDQAHSVLPRSLRILGIPDQDIRVLPSDGDFRISVPELAAAVAADRAAGRRPWLVAATAGTTNTGAVDPLPELAGLCRTEGMWLHVDGAFGATAALCEAGRALLPGLELADSLVLDPHKWLFQPVDAGCVLIRHAGALHRAFSADAEYLKDVTAHDGPADYRNCSPELTRRARALKMWLSFEMYGTARIREAIAWCLHLAEFAEETLRADEGTWEVVTPARLGVVTFVLRGGDEALHQARSAELARQGFATATPTHLRGRSVLRLCLINPLTTHEDVVETLERLAKG